MEVVDELKGKAPKRYEEMDEVDVLDATGMPTGEKRKVPRYPAYERGTECERWLEGALTDLPNQRLDQLDAEGRPTGRKLKPTIAKVERDGFDVAVGISVAWEPE